MSDAKDKTVDWEAVRTRLANMERTLTEQVARSPERTRAVLKTRAATLRTPRDSGAATDDAGTVLACFTVGDERYGVALGYVREVFPLVHLSVLPGAPDVFVGALARHGQVLPVIDVAVLLGSTRRSADGGYAIVLGTDAHDLALAVDAVMGVATVPDATLLPSPIDADVRDAALITGVTREGLIALDGDALLTDPRLDIVSSVR